MAAEEGKMKNINLLCLGCMKEKPSEGICPYCHFDLNQYEHMEHRLSPQTILNGKYILGKALGEGGFGITYIGLDLNLQIVVAIKEYFPSGIVSRNVTGSDTVSVLSKGRAYYEKGRERFLLEAQTLARFYDKPGIVSVKDFFEENGTAYIVMEYLEGEDFGHFISRNGGRLSADSVLTMMEPVIVTLAEVHAQGLIHRDISPDNIMITKDSQVKLLDFGAARDVTDENKSLSIMLKPGYAPIEQYQTKGKQGPWTDVYALCATIYRAITGIKPEESMSRVMEDKLKTPTELGISMDGVKEYVLLKGLEIKPEERWQNMGALYRALYEQRGIDERESSENRRNQQIYQPGDQRDGKRQRYRQIPTDIRTDENIKIDNENRKKAERERKQSRMLFGFMIAVFGIFIFAFVMLMLEMSQSKVTKKESQYTEAQNQAISNISSDKEEEVTEQSGEENLEAENISSDETGETSFNNQQSSRQNLESQTGKEEIEEEEQTETTTDSSLIGKSIGVSEEIPQEIRESMIGITVPDNSFDFSGYSYLSIPYHNFDGGDSVGHMIVNASLADEILSIFQELYEIGYPIEKMELLDLYQNSIEPVTKPVDNLFDEKLSRMNKVALADNDSFNFAFFLTGNNELGYHAKGNAIDLNPRINPAREKNIIPSNGAEYFDRNTTYEDETIEQAMIRKGDAVYNIFKKYGWKWGGEWESTPYYHHFYKN